MCSIRLPWYRKVFCVTEKGEGKYCFSEAWCISAFAFPFPSPPAPFSGSGHAYLIDPVLASSSNFDQIVALLTSSRTLVRSVPSKWRSTCHPICWRSSHHAIRCPFCRPPINCRTRKRHAATLALAISSRNSRWGSLVHCVLVSLQMCSFFFSCSLHQQDPKDTPPPTRVETREERLERRRKEKAEQVAYKLEREIAIWDPQKLEACTEDPFKTLFVARIVSYTLLQWTIEI